MASPLAAKLQELIEPTVQGMGYELVGVEYLPQGKRSLLRVYIDASTGIGVDDCERVSHQISGQLDVADPIQSQYTLEVSSPGLDRPLFTTEHFDRFAGSKVRIRLVSPMNGRRKFTGVLQGTEGDYVVLTKGDERIVLSLDDIDKARLVPEI